MFCIHAQKSNIAVKLLRCRPCKWGDDSYLCCSGLLRRWPESCSTRGSSPSSTCRSSPRPTACWWTWRESTAALTSDASWTSSRRSECTVMLTRRTQRRDYYLSSVVLNIDANSSPLSDFLYIKIGHLWNLQGGRGLTKVLMIFQGLFACLVECWVTVDEAHTTLNSMY